MNQPEAQIHYSAGGLVYRERNGSFEVVMIKDSYGRWTFPKGHLEPNETPEEAALREIAEETGLDLPQLTIKTELGELNYWFTSSFARDQHKKPAQTAHGKTSSEPVLIHKYVTYYLVEAPADSQLTPQEGEVEAIEWVPVSQISEWNEYDDNKELIKSAKNYLYQLEIGKHHGLPTQSSPSSSTPTKRSDPL